jgi:hypothetical protein
MSEPTSRASTLKGFDTSGNFYGTTYQGGIGYGALFEVTP